MSYASMVAGLCGLTVTGVTRTLAYPPAQINTADLPLLFPSLPRGENRIASLAGDMELPTMHLNLAIVVEPVMQGQPSQVFNTCIALFDALAAALDVATVTQGVVGYTTRLEVYKFGLADTATDYWTLVTEVEVI